jgi:AcrR family transcriptional regulator
MHVSLRERKKAQTREDLYEAARESFRARGFDHVTIDEIAEHAGVSRRTFFRYFPTKEAVVFPHQADRVQAFREALAEKVAGEQPFEAVRRACRAISGAFMAGRDELILQRALIEGSAALIVYERRLDREWEAAIAEALIERSPDSNEAKRKSRIIAAAAMGALRAALDEWYAEAGQSDLIRIGEEAMDLLANGVMR